MFQLNVPESEARIINAIDSERLDELIEQCYSEERSAPLQKLRLESCGAYLSTRLRAFERAILAHSKAKASQKRADTEADVRKAGRYLSDALLEVKHRVATEEQEQELYFVDDRVTPPPRFSEALKVQISYRWRKGVVDRWNMGSVVFSHTAVDRPSSLQPAPARKPSAAKRESDRQDNLHEHWEHLRDLGLQAVREHFRKGGSGTEVPSKVQAKTDSFGQLNNLSAQF